MKTWLTGVGVILGLELRQRVRGRAWYILLGVFTVLVAAVTLLLWLSLNALGGDAAGGIFSTLIYFVLLLGTLVVPAVSGNAINGDRAAGTLATTQVTLISTWQLVLGKFLAAWISALAFLAAAVPFLVLSILIGEIGADTILVSVLILALELGVLAAVGVGLSGLLTRPLFSIVVTYLVVAALSVGTLIAFGLLGLTVQSTATSTYEYHRYDFQTGELELDENGQPFCDPPQVSRYEVPRYDHFWGALVANPYVVLADAAPTHYDEFGNPTDLFGFVKLGARSAQLSPDLETYNSDCDPAASDNEFPSGRQVIESTTPGWFVGLTLHLLLAAGLLVGGWSATRTPTGRLPKDSRVA